MGSVGKIRNRNQVSCSRNVRTICQPGPSNGSASGIASTDEASWSISWLRKKPAVASGCVCKLHTGRTSCSRPSMATDGFRARIRNPSGTDVTISRCDRRIFRVPAGNKRDWVISTESNPFSFSWSARTKSTVAPWMWASSWWPKQKPKKGMRSSILGLSQSLNSNCQGWRSLTLEALPRTMIPVIRVLFAAHCFSTS